MNITELEFNYIYGTVFSADTTAEYCENVAYILDRACIGTYERNLAQKAHKTNKALASALRRKITEGMNAEQKAIALAAVEHHKDLVYEFFNLDPKQQQRVKGLINRMKKEATNMQVVREEMVA